MNRLLIILSLLLVTSCATISDLPQEGTNAEWTMSRVDPQLSGFTPHALPSAPVLLWSQKGSLRTVASPLVYDHTIYKCDKKGFLTGYDEQGTIVFQYDLQVPVESSFVISDSIMYLGQMDGHVRAISLTKMKDVWDFETLGQISASPNLLGKNDAARVVVGSYDNNMYTLDARNGHLVSKVETGYYINGTAAVTGSYAVFGGCDTWLRIIDTRNGLPVDSVQLDAYIPSSPAIDGNHVYVSDYKGNLYDVVLSDGRVKEHRKLIDVEEDEGSVLSMPAVCKDAVCVLSEGRFLQCLDKADGSVRWKKMLKGDVGESSPLICKNRVLACTKNGYVSIHDLESGEELWSYEAGEQIISTPAIATGRLYILTARGTLMCFGNKIND